jgi:hypothetical protein
MARQAAQLLEATMPAEHGVCQLLDRHGGILFVYPQNAKQVLGAHRSA